MTAIRASTVSELNWSVLMLKSLVLIGLLTILTGCVTHREERSPDGFLKPVVPAASRLATLGRGEYFILEPGYQLVLTNEDDVLVMTVTEDTRRIGEVYTRVVEEREMHRGELKEISRSFLSIDTITGDVWYFGEEVDNYEAGKVTGHHGAWMAFEDGAKPGMLIPGRPIVGMKAYQEMAPGVAMDRYEVLNTGETMTTPNGQFINCLKTAETSDLEKGTEFKFYAPGVGLIAEGDLRLKHIGDGKAH